MNGEKRVEGRGTSAGVKLTRVRDFSAAFATRSFGG